MHKFVGKAPLADLGVDRNIPSFRVSQLSAEAPLEVTQVPAFSN